VETAKATGAKLDQSLRSGKAMAPESMPADQSLSSPQNPELTTVGKTSTVESMNDDASKVAEDQPEKKETPMFNKGIPLESIPLKWCNVPEIGAIFDMVSHCYGPYGFQNSIQGLDTVEVLKKIHRLAEHAMVGLGQRMKRPVPLPHEPSVDLDNAKKLKSAQLTNKAVMQYFSLAEHALPEIREKFSTSIRSCLEQAVALNPRNAAAALNLKLFDWQNADITDEDLHDFLVNELVKIDAGSAKMMYLLYKNNVDGSALQQSEVDRIVSSVYCNLDQASNLAQELLKNPFFLTAENTAIFTQCLETGIPGDVMRRENLTEESQILPQVDSNKAAQNHQIPIRDKNFEAKSFFISNGDNYIGVIGEKEFKVVDARAGKILITEPLPTIRAKHAAADDEEEEYSGRRDRRLSGQHIKEKGSAVVGLDSQDESV
jgi:hypothetical protein